LFNDFQEWYDSEHERIEQERLLQQEQKEQQSLNKSRFKKIKDEDVSYTDDLRDVFLKYYDKSFKPVKKWNSKDFVFFKYSTDNGNDNDNEKEDLESEEKSLSSSSEELESKDLVLKEMFQNGYFYTDIEKIFPKFYKDNKSKINFLYTQVLDERFKKDRTLEIEKNIDVCKCKQQQIDIIKKRRQLWKTNRKNKNIIRDLNMILTFRVTNVSNLRKTLNLILLMRSRKWKKNLKLGRSSKEIIVMILKMRKSSSS
jgi:hypothetical protein